MAQVGRAQKPGAQKKVFIKFERAQFRGAQKSGAQNNGGPTMTPKKKDPKRLFVVAKFGGTYMNIKSEFHAFEIVGMN